MGAGQSLEAAFTLTGPIPAGAWHLVGDGLIFDPCDVTFDVLWRAADGDHPLVSWTHHFDPAASSSMAVPYADDAMGPAANAVPKSDKLVLRISAQGDTAQMFLYQPNGDGANTGGNYPSLTIPQ